MKINETLPLVRQLMLDFAKRTGLSPLGAMPRRYLWTDAFAVCNFLVLYRQSGEETFKALALNLVDQVHAVLGRHRPDDSRSGWISGLDEAQGRAHPTAGGLRIGKKMNERGPGEPVNAELEWEQDGQYYHYLTKWMHALNQVGTVTADPIYHVWAKELARAVHAAFVTDLGGRGHIRWKMSIDLSRPLVPSMGHHDPLDGFITCHQLMACGPLGVGDEAHQPDLRRETGELEEICRGRNWATNDALGIGCLLCSALQTAHLIAAGYFAQHELLQAMLEDALSGLQSFAGRHDPALPANYRLAFRELGLSIGLHAAARLQGLLTEIPARFTGRDRLSAVLAQLLRYSSLARTIEKFWLAGPSREGAAWTEHADINMVMLATSLAPDGFLRICAR
ncbi:MAG: hypothetical protein HY885_07295 [Deltaproteobacteria bacterium]|nr:hypothetical protein [Deltaproteobacteria bacterium]